MRQRSSELLRLVEQGETIEITDRGRPVACLAPVPDGGPMRRMMASGEIERASAELSDLPQPLVLPRGAKAPSSVLKRVRSEER